MSRCRLHRLYQSAWRKAKPAIASLLMCLVSASRAEFLRKPKSLAMALFEDSCDYVVLLFFILVSIVITKAALTAAKAVSGEIPSVMEYGVYLAEAFLLLKYIRHTYRTL